MERYCSNCGHKLEEGADVCIKCGKIIRNGVNFSFNIPAGSKSKIAAALLAFFLGNFGVHNFYIGEYGKGICQLLLTIIGWIILIGPLVARIWSFIEFVFLLTGGIDKDGFGNPLY